MSIINNYQPIPAVLERIANGYASQRKFAYNLLPLYQAEVARDSYKVAKFGKDFLKTEDFRRASGAEPKRVKDNIEGWADIATYRYTVESAVDRGDMVTAEDVVKAGLLASERRLTRAYERLFNSIEVEQVKAVSDAAQYPSGNTSTPTGNNAWSHESSDPVAQIQKARQAVKSKTGFYPNKMVISDPVWQVLRRKDNLLAHMPMTSLKTGLTPEDFGKICQIDSVIIADNMVNTGQQLDFTWSKNVILAYVPDTIYTLDEPVFGITIRAPLGYNAMRSYYDDRTTSDVVAIDERIGWSVVNYEAGYLFKNVIS
ncbi:hypothetical protein SAMN02745150_01186 [Brevinema andersonii]|uniref:Phage major capsid protein E n=1 Tax=Brevinema andersonii TaxID=34097 RepID=A0A1I1EU70_BREAD|nr:hypothetical protein [Brevinema andersonii]SFB88470.1 hypothetical protein SAMN02745150_01186 [Brevinema andersonii]